MEQSLRSFYLPLVETDKLSDTYVWDKRYQLPMQLSLKVFEYNFGYYASVLDALFKINILVRW